MRNLLVIVLTLICISSCGYSEGEMQKIKDASYEKGRSAGSYEGYKRGVAVGEKNSEQRAAQAFLKGKKEGLVEGERIGEKKGRRYAFLEGSAIGIGKITPYASIFGAGVFIASMSFYILWVVSFRSIFQRLGDFLESFKWSTLSQFSKVMKLKNEIRKWDAKEVQVDKQIEVMKEEEDACEGEIIYYQNAISQGLPKEVVPVTMESIARLRLKKNRLKGGIKRGVAMMSEIRSVVRAINMTIYQVQNGSLIDDQKFKDSFNDLSNSIASYVQSDIANLQEYYSTKGDIDEVTDQANAQWN